MKRDQLNDQYLDLVEKQRLYFKTVKEFKEVLHFKQISQNLHHLILIATSYLIVERNEFIDVKHPIICLTLHLNFVNFIVIKNIPSHYFLQVLKELSYISNKLNCYTGMSISLCM